MVSQSKSWLLPFTAFLAGALAAIVAVFHSPGSREVLEFAPASDRWLAALRWPEPGPRHEQEFRLSRDAEHPLLVTDSRTQDLPYVFGDCDLDATVEVPEGGELDLVVRKVEFTIHERQGHGRFAGLRLSTREEGPAWRTREQLVFGDGASGGIKVAPGLGATLHLEMRGRTIHATVAGRVLAPFECDDTRGAVAFLARGGTGVIRYLRVSDPRREARLEFWFLAALAAAAAGLLVALMRPRVGIAMAFTCVVPLGGFVARILVFSHLAPLATPALSTALVVTLWMLPLWIALALPRWRAFFVPLAFLIGVGALEYGVRSEDRRLEPLCDERFDLVFGRGSSTGPFDALCGRLRSRTEVHTVIGDETRLLFLGGEDLFEAGDRPEQWAAVQAAGALVARVRRPVEAVVAATRDANTRQQLALYELFYERFAPKVLVFGVPSDESEPHLLWPVRELWAATGAAKHALPRGPSRLWQLCERVLATRVPASSPAELTATLREVFELCERRHLPLVLAAGTALADAHAAALTAFAAEHHLPLVRDVLGSDGRPQTTALVLAIAPWLPAGQSPGKQSGQPGATVPTATVPTATRPR